MTTIKQRFSLCEYICTPAVHSFVLPSNLPDTIAALSSGSWSQTPGEPIKVHVSSG